MKSTHYTVSESFQNCLFWYSSIEVFFCLKIFLRPLYMSKAERDSQSLLSCCLPADSQTSAESGLNLLMVDGL